ncbi:predicted protein [Plenodomus lingam JN3]|uniref:Uncharacterized protein n=1 Tax=Leptosphaeria maculans (strain JN3 / isolate v23.1.3 / race Av1-4-5-6-7-8) TaxID=985895 RepID=E4ZGN1_LEPMJ|nr:predicted protein [Plenodomus lingam JN3]CBX90451.1 predicted protein [Plenodomus lingam JN3]
MKLLYNLTILAFSTTLIQGALLSRNDTEISGGGLSNRVEYVHVTEYSTVYVQPNTSTAPPGGWNFTQTSEVVVTTTLNTTTSSSTDTYHSTIPAQSSVRLDSSSIHGTGVFNWPAPSSQPQSRPAASVSATPALSHLPKFSYAPSRTSCSKCRIVGTGKPSLGRTSIPPSTGAGSAIYASTSRVATVSVETTAIVVVPVHPSSLGFVAVPTHPSTPAVVIVPTHPSTPAVVIVPIHPSTPAIVVVPTHPPVAAKAMNYTGRLGQSVGIKPERDIHQDIAHVLPRAGPTVINTTIEHGTWSYHKHGANNVEVEHGDLAAILPNTLDGLPGKQDSDNADSVV